MRKLVFVVGAGRSGTSAITNALQVLGVDLGETLMPANPEFNRKGYFEDLDFFEFNNRLFDDIGSVWHDLSLMTPQDAIKEDVFEKGHSLLARKLEGKDLFGVKDPQISRIIPFWNRIAQQTGVADHYVIALRHPLSVARSLSKYANFSLARCFEIWFIFSLQSLADSPRGRRIVLSYESLLKDPGHEIARIAALLGVDFDSGSEAFRAYSEEFLDKSDNHNDVLGLPDEDRQWVPAKVAALYEFALRLANDSLEIDGPEARAQMDHFLGIRRNDLSLAGIVTEQDRKIARFEKDFELATQTIQSLIGRP